MTSAQTMPDDLAVILADEAACKLDGMFRDIFNQEERHDLIRVILAAAKPRSFAEQFETMRKTLEEIANLKPVLLPSQLVDRFIEVRVKARSALSRPHGGDGDERRLTDLEK